MANYFSAYKNDARSLRRAIWVTYFIAYITLIGMSIAAINANLAHWHWLYVVGAEYIILFILMTIREIALWVTHD